MNAKDSNYVRVPRWVIGLAITLIFGLLSFAVVWGMFKNRVEENTASITTLQREVTGLERMRTDLEVIKNDVGWIKNAIGRRNGDKSNSRRD